MQPSRQKRQWHAQWQSRPGSSTDHRETKRRLHDQCLRHGNQDDDPWPPRSTSRLQQRRHADSAAIPSWRDRVNRPVSQAQGGNRWIRSEAAEHSQRRQPSVRRWRSPEPPVKSPRFELDSSSDSRSWAQRHQGPHSLRVQRPPDVARRGGGLVLEPVVYERWDSEVARYARSTQPQWAPNASHDDDGDDGDDYYCDDDEEEDDDDEAEDDDDEASDEQNNFTLTHRYSPPARSHERRQNNRGDHRLQRTDGPIRLSHEDHVGVLHKQVPSWPARRQLLRRVELPARRWSQSDKCFPDSASETSQERATHSLTTRSVDVQSYPVRPTKRAMVETMKSVSSIVRRLHTFEASQAPSLEDKHEEALDDDDDIGYEGNGHSTSKRRPSALGKHKATLKRDVATVDCGDKPGEELVPVKPNVSGCKSGIVKPREHRKRKQYRKRCQYPEGCDKSAQGSTMLCNAHGGGKRCQYPEGCDKLAKGSTMFCIAHGGGKRCQYPEGCSKGAVGSTMFCAAHGGGKRCQYPDGCDKTARGSTMFCAAHGGGNRCQYPEGCGNSAIGQTLFCRAHGGGKRCQYPQGCDKGAEGSTVYCIAHGGGRRCQYREGCDKSARSSTIFCIAHGGGKRCQYPEGCGKSAEGSTMFCKAHGGGKRCQHPEGCDKSAQGSTMFCRAHGGGRRCQYPDGCGKGAEGSTMFCTAHGGGRRCQYPEGYDKGARSSNLFCIAHGGGRRGGHESGCHKLVTRRGLCKSHGAEAGV
jgi:hypothetical protein